MEYTERYVTKFYQNLEHGRLVGQVCGDCGRYQVFPAPCCRHCQSTNMEYADFSMRGKLVYVLAANFASEMYMKSGLYPMGYGAVQCEEGPVLYIPVIEGINLKDLEGENKRLPLPVVLETREIGGNFVPVAKVVKE